MLVVYADNNDRPFRDDDSIFVCSLHISASNTHAFADAHNRAWSGEDDCPGW